MLRKSGLNIFRLNCCPFMGWVKRIRGYGYGGGNEVVIFTNRSRNERKLTELSQLPLQLAVVEFLGQKFVKSESLKPEIKTEKI